MTNQVRFFRPTGGLFIVAAALWLAVLAALIWLPQMSHWPVRAAATALAAAVIWRFLTQNALMLISPLVLLAAMIIMFFSLAPAVFAKTEALDVMARLETAILRYLSGPAELIALQFAIGLLAVSLLLQPSKPSASEHSRPGATDLVRIGAIATLVVLAVFLGLCRFLPGLAAWTHSGIGLQLVYGVPALISFCVAALSWVTAIDRRWRLISWSASLLGCIALLGFVNAKMPVFIATCCLLLHVVAQPLSLRKLGAISAGIACGIVVAILAIAEIRTSSISNFIRAEGPRPSSLTLVVGYKLVLRQMETTGCFSNTVDRRLMREDGQSPFYFFGAIVPRFLWPSKPNLSTGDRFATDYCDLSHTSVYVHNGVYMPGAGHSASVTLLGEPVIEAGLGGLIVAEAAILSLLALFTITAVRAGPAGLIAVTALLPWLIDFDQSLAIYVANAIKTLIYLSPAILILMRVVSPLSPR